MRVYFVGAHSVGKTTLARQVSKKYNLPLITEVARSILSKNETSLNSLRTDINLVNEYQDAVFRRQIEEESKFEDNFVSDRCFDFLAYAGQHTTILKEIIESDEMKKYIKSLMKKDSFIFFVRPSKVTMKNDGVREDVNWDGIITIDAMIKFVLEMFKIRYYQINFDNMQERLRLIEAVLSNG